MRTHPTQQEIQKVKNILPRGIGEGGEVNSYSHSDTKPAAPSSIGTSRDEQTRFIISDEYGKKFTNWIPRHRQKLALKHLKNIGFHLHEIQHRDVVCDLFLNSNNTIDREVIEVVEL